MKLKIKGRTVDLPRRSFAHCPDARETLTRKHTPFTSFDELLCKDNTYRPSIYLDGKSRADQQELLFLAFEYNRFQQARGDGRRVYKGDWHPVFRREFPILDELDLGPCAVPDCENRACDIMAISIDNKPKKGHAICRQHYDAAYDDMPLAVFAPATQEAVLATAAKWVQGD